jgi:hypothetical protein
MGYINSPYVVLSGKTAASHRLLGIAIIRQIHAHSLLRPVTFFNDEWRHETIQVHHFSFQNRQYGFYDLLYLWRGN